MDNDFPLTQGDLLPVFVYDLRQPDGSIPDLTGATIKLRYRNQDLTVAAEVLRDMTVQDLAQATVRYQWITGDTDTAGVLLADIRVTYSDGSGPETFPNNDYIRIRIKAKP